MSFLSQPISIIPIRPQRSIGGINVNVVLTENTTDTLTITKQPVQQGASITDHSFLEPTVFTTTIYQQANLTVSLQQIYQNFLTLQSSRSPFDIVTPKRVYTNMLMTTISVATDKNTENILSLSISCQQVIFVTVGLVNTPRAALANPGSNGATQQAGPKNVSAIEQIHQAVAGFKFP